MMYILEAFLESISYITVILAVAVCLLIWVYNDRSSLFLGPVGLPYLGYYPFLNNDFHLQFSEMRKKYGDVFLIKYTGQIYVHLPTLKSIKEALVTKADCFERRPMKFTLLLDAFGDGVGFVNGENWRVLRKFFSQQLKEYGLGKKTQATLIGDSLQKITDALEESKGQNFDAGHFFTNMSTEAICHLLFKGATLDDDDLQRLVDSYKSVLEVMGGLYVLYAGPLLRYVLMYLKPKLRRYRKHKSQMKISLTKIVRRHEKEFDENNIRNLVDCYVNERRILEQKGDRKSKIFSESSLVYTLMQFFGDGSLTVGSFTAGILKELAKRPDVQKKIQCELDDVVGRNRFPSWDDRSQTPYTNAAIYETIRLIDSVLIFPSVECTKETTVGGCRIPKGAVTLVNFWAAVRDPDVYKDPETFDVTRFLQDDTKKPKSELPIIFGVGKRSCMGEPLANMEIYLSVTTALQNFDLHPAKDDPSAVSKADKNSLDLSMMFRATRRLH